MSSRIISAIRAIRVGLIPPAGSSSRISFGSSISTWASSTSFRCPNESASAGWSRYSCMPTNSSSSSARLASSPLTAPARSWPQEKLRSGATTFSSTVMSANTRVIWKVLPIPAYARAHGFLRSIRSPSSQTSPASARIVPPIRLKVVVLPEPFGPIRPVIVPRSTSNEHPSTARTPSKLRSRPLTSSSVPPAPEPAGAAPPNGLRSPRRAPTSAARPRLALRSSSSRTEGMIPFGSSRIVRASSPPKINRRELPPPNCWLANSFSGSMIAAPRTGPQRVPRPPSTTARMIWTLITMSNIPIGSMNAR